jgi:hypothetical protein
MRGAKSAASDREEQADKGATPEQYSPEEQSHNLSIVQLVPVS